MNGTVVLDARHLLCPIPVIRTQDRITSMQPGQTLQVIATDPGTRFDIPAWCRVHGHSVTEIDEADGEIHFFIQVCSPYR